MMIKAMVLAALTLTGCSQLYDFTPQVIQEKKQYSDVERDAAMQGPCLMTLGSYVRLDDARQKATADYAAVVCH